MVNQITNSLPYFILVLTILAALIFLAIIYFTGFSLKERFEKLGLKKSPFFKNLQNIFSRDAEDKKWVLEGKFQSFSYKVLDLIGIRPLGPVYDSLREATAALKEDIGTSDYLYKLPWFLMVGDSYAGKTTLLQNSNLASPISSPAFGFPASDPIIQWWFFEKGIVIDIKGRCLTSESLQKGESWEELLQALARYRPNRSIDGLILAIPAPYFIGLEALPREDLIKRAQLISDQLIKTEKTLGFRLPLYPILTKCDQIAGFKGFCTELPSRAMTEIFGWSNPYVTGLSYNPQWVKEAFTNIYGFLFQSVLKIFSNRETSEYQDDVMMFPQAFLKLQQGVQSYLDVLFKVGDYRDHFILRGLFSTGFLDEKASINKTFQPFLKDLFTTKIFKEVGIANALKRFLISTNRTINLLKLASVGALILGGSNLYFSEKHLSNAVRHLKPALYNTLIDIQQYGSHDTYDERIGSYLFQFKERTVLELVVETSTHPLRSLGMIPSWLSFLPGNLNDTVFKVYNLLIAKPMNKVFDKRAQKIMVDPVVLVTFNGEENKGKILDPTSTPEFLLLEGYVDSLFDLQNYSALYNTLPHTKSLKALSEISKYLYEYEFPAEFLQGPLSSLKKRIVEKANYAPFNLNNYRLFAEKRLYSFYNHFLKRILDPDYNYALVQKLQNTLTKVEGQEVLDLENFRNSLTEIKNLMTFITESPASWLTNSQFDPGSKYHKMIDKIQNIFLFNPSVLEKMAETSAALYEKATLYLRSYGSPLTGYFLTVSSATKRLIPSPGLLDLEKRLNVFLEKSFMQKNAEIGFVDKIVSGQILHWDPQIIRNALVLVQSYREFLDSELGAYPANLQDTLMRAGKEQLQKNIDFMLEKAQTFFEEPTYDFSQQAMDAAQLETDNIAEIGPLFIKLLKELDRIGAREIYSKLRNLLFEQMYENLKKLDKSLTESDYYFPSDSNFQNWKGDKNALLNAYNMVDRTEMESYCANQNAQIVTFVIQYAAPIVEFLKSDVFPLDVSQVKLISRWYALVEQAVTYQKSKPASSIKALEKFIEYDGNEITYESCFTSLNLSEMNQPTSDFFLSKRNALMQALYKRCQEMAAQKGAIQYNKLADFFNTYMANAFPFVTEIPKTLQVPYEVSTIVLTNFFKDLDLMTAELINSIESTNLYGQEWEKAKKFLNDMNQVRDFFQTYFSPTLKGGTPGLNFDIQFKQNSGREVESQNVSDWGFIFGEKAISLLDPNGNTGFWEAGQDVSFGFEWNPSSLTPILEVSNTVFTQKENRTLFIYSGTWSLLRGMMIHLASVKEGADPNNDVLYKFEIPLGTSPKGPLVTTAQLYLKLIPKTAMGLPAVNFKIPRFPIQAPVLKVRN